MTDERIVCGAPRVPTLPGWEGYVVAGNLAPGAVAVPPGVLGGGTGAALLLVEGPQGEKGEPGAAGPQGPDGPRGDAGPIGPKGETGAAGPQGERGLQGAKGDTGAPGPAGPQGSAGATGPAGPQGLKGDTGATGPAGPQGLKGDTGATGPAGPQGLKGDTGAVGASGPPGPGIYALGPDAFGQLAWSDDPALITTTLKPASGALYFSLAIAAQSRATGAGVTFWSEITAAATALTYARHGLYRLDGDTLTLIALSPDLSTIWTGTGAKSSTAALTAAVTAGDLLYIATLATGTTIPTFRVATNATLTNTATPRRRISATGQSALPASASASSYGPTATAIGVLIG